MSHDILFGSLKSGRQHIGCCFAGSLAAYGSVDRGASAAQPTGDAMDHMRVFGRRYLLVSDATYFDKTNIIVFSKQTGLQTR